jgi:catechol 2,3-dioxygenase-like lactoylglutathione lyase family enzyme
MKFDRLTLLTNRMDELRQFYIDRLGLPLLTATENQFACRIGASELCFKSTNKPAYYHYAINIPSNLLMDAMGWLAQKGIDILPFEGAKKVIFEDWNAEALYFHDPAGNIVEFIARKNLNIIVNQEFDSALLLSISEIGIPYTSPNAFIQTLINDFNIPHYSGDLHRFAALGDEEGLFIIVDPEQKKWIPTFVDAIPQPIELEFWHQDARFQFSIHQDAELPNNYQILDL